MKTTYKLIALFLVFKLPVYSQWSSNPNVNTMVCNATGTQKRPQIVPDGSGGAIMIWEDNRSTITQQDIYAQRINSRGEPLWTSNGVEICTARNYQSLNENPDIHYIGESTRNIIADGFGGAIITWQDSRTLEGRMNIYAQRINANGQTQWSHNGIMISTVATLQYNPQLVSDGLGGAIITWQDSRNGPDGYYDIYAQHVNADGIIQWDIDGVDVSNGVFIEKNPGITSDGNGGAIIGWLESISMRMQRINANGIIQWVDGGIEIPQIIDSISSFDLLADGWGGAVITWDQYKNSFSNIYAQRINADGVIQWHAGGVEVCGASQDQRNPQIISNGPSNFIVTWEDGRNGGANEQNIYAQQIDGGGNTTWANDGVALCNTISNEHQPVIVSDRSGGAIVAWQKSPNPSIQGIVYDVYAQHIDASGNVLWDAANGVAIATNNNAQLFPSITWDNSGGAIITWTDFSAEDVFVQNICYDGSIGNSSTLTCARSAKNEGEQHNGASVKETANINSVNLNIAVYPNPSNSGFVTVDFGRNEVNSISLINAVGAVVKTITVNTHQSLVSIGTENLPSGIYLLSVQTNNNTIVKRVSINNQ